MRTCDVRYSRMADAQQMPACATIAAVSYTHLEKDANERKTMNTHLHILEPYTNLYRVWKDARLERQLYNLIGLFTEKILDKDTSHLQLFFDNDWQSKYPVVSLSLIHI